MIQEAPLLLHQRMGRFFLEEAPLNWQEKAPYLQRRFHLVKTQLIAGRSADT
jgi:hypothetical protein